MSSLSTQSTSPSLSSGNCLLAPIHSFSLKYPLETPGQSIVHKVFEKCTPSSSYIQRTDFIPIAKASADYVNQLEGGKYQMNENVNLFKQKCVAGILPSKAVNDSSVLGPTMSHIHAETSTNNQKPINVVSSDSSSTAQKISSACISNSLCVICGCKATGRHYGAVSCEGCKGFFRRSVRRSVNYACKENLCCSLKPPNRNRCQFCRYQKCITMGMRKEVVQEERHQLGKRLKRPFRKASTDVTVSSQCEPNERRVNSMLSTLSKSEEAHRSPELSICDLVTAELLFDFPDSLLDNSQNPIIYADIGSRSDNIEPLIVIMQSVESKLPSLVDWARSMPAFSEKLSINDQLALLKSAWPEILLTSLAFRSSSLIDGGFLLANHFHLSMITAQNHGLGPLASRLQNELVTKFREMQLDRTELAILKAILLFNSDAPDVSVTGRQHLDSWRDELYAALHAYCTAAYPAGSSRFTKLLLRLSPLRSISMKCLEHLVFAKLVAEDPTSRRLLDLIENRIRPSTSNPSSLHPLSGPSTSHTFPNEQFVQFFQNTSSPLIVTEAGKINWPL